MTHKRIILKYTAFLLLLCIIVLPMGAYASGITADAASEGVVTASELYMRTGPGTDYGQITDSSGTPILLTRNQRVKVLESVEGSDRTWYYISAELNGTQYEGYSAAEYISTDVGAGNPETTEAPSVTPTPADKPDVQVSKADGYSYPGYVTASVLTLREKAGTSKKQITTLPRDTKVNIIGSKMITLKDKSNQRWYLVTTEVDGSELKGYVLSDYVRLELDEYVPAVVKQSEIKLNKTADSASKKVKDGDKKVIVLKKNTSLTIISEKTVDGVKWFRVKFKYNKKSYKGYVTADMIKFDAKQAETTPGATPAPTPTPEPQPGEELPEATPTVKPELDMEGANAVIKDAAALAVKAAADYAAGTVKTESGMPVLLYSGQAVQVVDVTAAEDITWCYVRFLYNGSEYYGYINARYIEGDSSLGLMNSGSNNAGDGLDFEARLERENFPESYRVLLAQLHAQYPDWQFKAFHTGLDWNEVIENQSTTGKNLIPNSRSVEWKSLESGAYSWKTDSFVVFDGSSWVTASKEAIAYYMDPRNYLTADGIFQFEVLAYNPSYQTESGVDNILTNTAMYGSSYTYPDELGNSRAISYRDTFMMAAEYSGVSPFHLASRVKQEVTLGTSALSNSVSGTVAGLEGLYNFYNIGAYHSTVPGENIANGLRFAQSGSSSALLNESCLIPWNNRFKSILGGAYYIGYNYINRGQNTIYLQKFNVTQTDTYFHQYMANVEAPYAEGKKVYQAYVSPESIPIVFSIPVYENMPETACAMPEKAYNPNNWLKTLVLTDAYGNELPLTPTFNYTKDQEYSLIVDGSTDLINIGAGPVSRLASVISAPQAALEPGLNVVRVMVMAEDSTVREYVINIVRESGDGAGYYTEAAATPEPSPAEPTPTEPLYSWSR